MKDTSSVGQIGETAVLQRLLRAGWRAALPYDSAAPYDLIPEKNGRCVRVQVRTTQARTGFVSVNCRGKNNRSRMSANSFDFLVVYELTEDKAFVIPANEAESRAVMHIRLAPSAEWPGTGDTSRRRLLRTLG